MKKQRLELTVKRPCGKIEIVIAPNINFITDTQFRQIQRDTKKANGSDVLSYKNVGVKTAAEWDASKKANQRAHAAFRADAEHDAIENMSKMGDC